MKLYRWIHDKIEGSRWGYLRVATNWHKHPTISKILCTIGRHDFFVEDVNEEWVILRCFYCERASAQKTQQKW